MQQANEELEQYGRRLCVRIDGVPTVDNETSDEVLDKVKSLIKGTLMQIWKSPYIFKFIWNTLKNSHSKSKEFLSYSPVKFSFFLKSRLIFNISYWLCVCKQTFCKLYWCITREFLRLKTRNFQGITFIWTQTYKTIFKSALVYL